jgi:CDP-diacylglycerol--glycerol-3-phosphate 3-phosphatidyltransferase
MLNNLPNLLTVGRIVLIAPFVVLFFAGGAAARWTALALFIVAAVTDWLDGYLARRLNQGSPLGRMLDPIADKLLVATALLVLITTRDIAGWNIVAALSILLREIAVSGFREHLGPLGVTVPVTALAKWKTTAQLVALSLLIAPAAWAKLPGIAFLWIAAILTLITGWGYLKATIAALK